MIIAFSERSNAWNGALAGSSAQASRSVVWIARTSIGRLAPSKRTGTSVPRSAASRASRLARHSAHGWNDPALPDDYKDIGQLLNITPEAVRQRIGLDPMPAREADGSEAG